MKWLKNFLAKFKSKIKQNSLKHEQTEKVKVKQSSGPDFFLFRCRILIFVFTSRFTMLKLTVISFHDLLLGLHFSFNFLLLLLLFWLPAVQCAPKSFRKYVNRHKQAYEVEEEEKINRHQHEAAYSHHGKVASNSFAFGSAWAFNLQFKPKDRGNKKSYI